MEAAVRWSPHSTDDTHRFLLVDVGRNTITLHEASILNKTKVKHKVIAEYDKVPNFTAFDWSRSEESLVAVGLSSGDASLVRIEPGQRNIQPLRVFPIKTQRKCNSINFNNQALLAVALDRVRNDHCLTVYDVNGGKEPHTRLCTGEAVSSVRFFPAGPQHLIAAVARTTLRLYDLRDSSAAATGAGNAVYTKQVNNIAIDPLDDNYFSSAGSTGDPTVSVWDKRWLARQSSTTSTDTTTTTPVLDLRPAVDNSETTTVWSVRYSGLQRGRFAILSSTGEVKLYDTTQHGMQPRSRSTPANFHGGNPWNLPHYVAKTHNLQYPYHDSIHGQSEGTRVVAFDWLPCGNAMDQSMVVMHPSRGVELLQLPHPCHASITPRDDLAMIRDEVELTEPITAHGDVAAEALAIRQKAQGSDRAFDRNGQLSRPDLPPRPRPLDQQSLKSLRGTATAVSKTKTWLNSKSLAPAAKVVPAEFADSLTLINIHKRRCQEGYRFDCRLNRDIASDDPDLVKLWAIVKRLEQLASNDGMLTSAMDLSFMGVTSIWHSNLGRSANRLVGPRSLASPRLDTAVQEIVQAHGLPDIEGLPSKTSDKRRLCLEICGWCFSNEGIENKCRDLLEQGLHYRAVAVAVFQEHVDLALSLLRDLTRTQVIQNTGLGALLASGTLNDEQRDMCRWMEEDASDPYLKALLRYLGTNNWLEVVDSTALNLSDRLSVALKYLTDAQVTSFIDAATAQFIKAGNVSGVLLTGLTESSMDLFQAYLTRTDDIQTAVLATSFTNPLYVDDVRWSMWQETYFWQMQSWRCFIERTRFTTEHTRRCVTRKGERLIKPPPRQIMLRCAHCHGSLARHQDDGAGRNSGHRSFDVASSAGKNTPAASAQKVAEAAGTVCPRCGRHMPRCSICMQWLGTPAPLRLSGRGVGSTTAEVDGGKENGPARRETELLSRFLTFCAACGHGFHAHHAKHWFAKHGMCPVPDCRCLCGLKG